MKETLCLKCLNNKLLIHYVTLKGRKIKKCRICGATNVKAVSSWNRGFSKLFKTLFRFNFSEWEYNRHLGGDGIEALLVKDSTFFKVSDLDPYELESAILSLIEPVYEKYESGISLYSGGLREGYPPLIALKDDYSPKLKKLTQQLLKQNHFLLEKEWIDNLKLLKNKIRKDIPLNSDFFRARIGFEEYGYPINSDYFAKKHYIPFSNSNIGAPPPSLASGGRMNRVGVSFLYLSSDIETAIAETRPYPSQIVSVGKFKSKKSLFVADLTSIKIEDFACSDKKLDDFLLLKSIEKIFSYPVPPDEVNKYTITQFLANIFRVLGFEGVEFKSSLCSGTNLTVFQPDNFEFVENSSEILQINKIIRYTETLEKIINKEDFIFPESFKKEK